MFNNMKRVITIGVFDLIHRGHVELFRRAKQYGDYLTVWVHEDNYIEKKGVVQSTEERIYMCKAIRYVDDAIPYGNLDEDIVKHDFEVLVCGEDQQKFPHFIYVRQWCKEHGKEFVVLPRTEGISSSIIRSSVVQKKTFIK